MSVHLIFDFDGTICDGLQPAIDIMNKFLAETHHPPTSLEEIRRVGFQKLYSQKHVSRVELVKFLLLGRRMMVEKIPRLKSFSGLPTVLKQLSLHHTLGIITSNSSTNVKLFLAANKLDPYFSFIDDSLNLFGKDKKIKRHRCDFYIGDETRDIEAARKAGVKCIAVSWGFESPEILSAHHPDFLVTSPSQLLDIFKS